MTELAGHIDGSFVSRHNRLGDRQSHSGTAHKIALIFSREEFIENHSCSRSSMPGPGQPRWRYVIPLSSAVMMIGCSLGEYRLALSMSFTRCPGRGRDLPHRWKISGHFTRESPRAS